MSLAVIRDTAPSQYPHRPPDLRGTVEELRRRNRRADEGRLAECLVTVLSEDADLLLEASRFIIEKISAAIDAQQRRQQAAPNTRQRAERKVTEQAAVAEIVEKVRLAVLDMTVMLVNGEMKKLRFVTGAELAGLGAAYTKLAAAIPPDAMLGECLTESEAAELLGSAS
jgi:DNA polymerase II large subunit